MPRVAIKKKDYRIIDFRKWLAGEMAVNGIKQKDIAEWFGISQPAVSQKIREGNFTLKELLIVFEQFKVPEEQIGKLLKV